MRNIWNIFVSDMRSLNANAVSVILAVGLVLMPSMFAWYNILACWDAFNNTGNLKVAVANTDEGYSSDLLPVDINVGEQVVDSLRANDQMDWIITDKDDAVDGAAGGRYYAALVIPESFSRDMMSFYSSNAQAAPLVYYSNEKKSAIAPKVTDQGADTISYTINKEFSETLSEIILNELDTMLDVAGDEETTKRVNDLVEHVGKTASQMRQHCKTLDSYASMIDSCRTIVEGSQDLLGRLEESAGATSDSIASGQEKANTLRDSLDSAVETLSGSIDSCAQGYDKVADTIRNAFDSSTQNADDTTAALQEAADMLSEQAGQLEEMSSALRGLASELPEAQAQSIEQFCDLLDFNAKMQRDSAESLAETIAQIESGSATLAEKRGQIEEEAQTAAASLQQLKDSYHADVESAIGELASNLADAANKVAQAGEGLSSAQEEMSTGLSEGLAKLDEAKASIEQASQKLAAAADELDAAHDKLAAAMDSGGVDKVKELIGEDTSALAANLAAPVGIERKAIFASNSFGSSMAPLYATLALWVGCLLSVVLIKTNPNEKTLSRCTKKPHLHEIFLGRFGLFAVISLLQSTVMAVGNMLFLQVQMSDPVLYLVCFWVSGLVFQFIMYTLVASFGNVGKAISVLLLIVQVTSSNGSYPLQLLPDFATILSPLMPATYVISAMRAAMFGVYQGDFWVYISQLLVFIVPMAMLGLLLRRPFVKINERFVEKTERSKLI